MDKIFRAILTDGTEIEYVQSDNPPRGSMKYTYFTPTKDKVIQFYNRKEDADDPKNRERLERILSIYNPTVPENLGGAKGGNFQTADYFCKLFCWVTGIRNCLFGLSEKFFLWCERGQARTQAQLGGQGEKEQVVYFLR